MPSAEAVEAVFRRHVIDAWFPRCLDHAEGGYLCDFDRSWSPLGPHDKLLEFQARQLNAAAEACVLYPGEEKLEHAVRHGFRYLREALWDHDAGGWFHQLDRSGRPLENETKHAHGIAYAIDACVSVYRALGDPSALELAKTGFDWLDRYSYDRKHGGHFGFLRRDGTVIRETAQSPFGHGIDTIGTPVGLKDVNVHSDLLETFKRLYQVWPDPVLRDRLAESIDIIANRMLVPGSGALHFYVTADWRPVPHLVRAGYQFQAAFRLTMAPQLTDAPEVLHRKAALLVDHALTHSRDPNGGFFYAVAGAHPDAMEGHSLSVTRKIWWVQAEALKALFTMSRIAPECTVYFEQRNAQWDYVHATLFDPTYHGSYSRPLRRRHRAFGARFAPSSWTRKGDAWKDALHETRSLVQCLEVLRSEAAEPGVRMREAQSQTRTQGGDARRASEGLGST